MQAGDLVGAYRLEALVAKGGMGAVWQARHPTLERRVAIKVIRAEARNNVDAQEAFLREVRSLARLRSPQTVQVIDSGFTETGSPWMATEFLEGEDLRERIGRSGPMPVADAVFVGIEVMKSLSEAHARGIVHRDLKPGNIFLQQVATVDGVCFAVKVLDFGVAKLLPTADGNVESTLWPQAPVKGSPRYMSPEQVTGRPDVSPASDLYAFGGTLYRALSGEPVFDGDRDHLFDAHVALAPKPLATRVPHLTIPQALDELVLRCLAKRPQDRPESADAVRRELETIRAQLTSGASPVAPALVTSAESPAWLVDGSAQSWAAEAEHTTPSPGPVASVMSSRSAWVSADDIPSLGSVDMRAAWLGAEESRPDPGAAAEAGDDALSAWLQAGVGAVASGPTIESPTVPPLLDDDPDFAPPDADDAVDDPLGALELDVNPNEVQRAAAAAAAPAAPAAPAEPAIEHGGSAWLTTGSASGGPSGSVTYVPPPTSARVERSGFPLAPLVVGVALLAAGGWYLQRGAAEAPVVEPDASVPAVTAPPVPAAPKLTAVDRQRDTRRDAAVRPQFPGAAKPEKAKPTVTVVADPGPARFVRADNGTVICASSKRCKLEIDVDYLVRKKGYRPKRISGDDLYDRRGGSMRAILQPN